MEQNSQQLQRELGLWSAILIVIASMIGAGIFGNTGIIQEEVGNPYFVIALWLLGGTVALAGAMSYAELATMMPHSGGEYVYIKEAFGLAPSFLTGWVSLIVGFSAPAASAALLSADYAGEFFRFTFPGTGIADLYDGFWVRKAHAVFLVLLFSYFHYTGVRKGGAIQNLLTAGKVGLVLAFTAGGFISVFFMGNGSEAIVQGSARSYPVVWEGAGVGLLFVMFAYSGWNGATYLAEEIRDPEKNLPRALFRGTVFIILLYVIINIIYYLAVPPEMMNGKKAVAALAAEQLFGKSIAGFFHLSFFFMLLSSLSVSLMIGPRVYYAMAKDGLFFKAAARVNAKTRTPGISIFIQAIFAILYVLSGSYDEILAYMGFALSIFPVLTVAGLMKLRKKAPHTVRPYKTPLYPLVPLYFIFFSIVIMATAFQGRPVESSIALAVVILGFPVYTVWSAINRRKEKNRSRA